MTSTFPTPAAICINPPIALGRLQWANSCRCPAVAAERAIVLTVRGQSCALRSQSELRGLRKPPYAATARLTFIDKIIHIRGVTFHACSERQCAQKSFAFSRLTFGEKMKVAVLGTGMVGQTLAAALATKGHEVMIGTRDVGRSLRTSEPNGFGMPAFGIWHKANGAVAVGTFADGAQFGELIINASNGSTALETLRLAELEKVGNKVLLDVSNDLDFSKGMPPKSGATDIAGTGLAERIQQAFPSLRVVKSLNTVNALVMVNPALVPGDSTVFMSGNDAEAKKLVHGVLTSFGWTDIMDLGGIATARGVEMLLPLWLIAFGVLGKPGYNFKIVR